jgi:hypothetical protein
MGPNLEVGMPDAGGVFENGSSKTEAERGTLVTRNSGFSLTERFCRAENVVGRAIAGEYILVQIVRSAADLDSIYHLNRVGAFVWERLDGCTPGEEIIRELTGQFEVDEDRATSDYQSFVAQLESVKVVTRCDGNEADGEKAL